MMQLKPALSPLNRHTIVARHIAEQCEGKKRPSEPVKVTMFLCPVCDEPHELIQDARDCCAKKPAAEDSCACPVCAEPHYSYWAAADCCLWKDYDAPTRRAMADKVEAGAEWLDLLGVIV